MTARILVVEDEGIVALDIEEGLRTLGYEVVGIVDSGEEAVRSAERERPDLVLMDVSLKGSMDGVEAAARIRDNFGIPVVYLTAHADESTLHRARVTTPYGFILKPFAPDDLRPAIELALYRYQQEQNSRPKIHGGGTSSIEYKLAEYSSRSPLELLSAVAPFSDLPIRARERLAEECRVLNFDAGELLAHEGDENVVPFLVSAGRIVMLKSSPSGKELIVDFVPPGDIFPVAVALKRGAYPFTAKTQVASTVVFLPSALLRLTVDEHPVVYKQIADFVTSRLEDSFEMARRLAHERVEVRIAAALLGMHHRLGISGSVDDAFDVELSRKDLADLTGTTPETACRVSKALESAGFLDLHQAGIVKVMNPEALEDIVIG